MLQLIFLLFLFNPGSSEQQKPRGALHYLGDWAYLDENVNEINPSLWSTNSRSIDDMISLELNPQIENEEDFNFEFPFHTKFILNPDDDKSIYGVCGRDDDGKIFIKEDNNNWKVLTLLPNYVFDCNALIRNNELWIIGGFPFYPNIQIFNLLTGIWSFKNNQNINRYLFGFTSSKNQIHVFGGKKSSSSSSSNEINAYNFDTNEWIKKKSVLSKNRYSSKAVYLIDSYIIICGGFNGNNSLNTVEIFNEERDEISYDIPQMIESRSNHGLFVMQNNNQQFTIYASGGNNNNNNIHHNLIESLQVSFEWAGANPSPTPSPLSLVGGGDPEYKSLDGLSFNYDGPCSYVATTNKCAGKESKYPLFEVIVHHNLRRHGYVGKTKSLLVIYKVSFNIWMKKGENVTRLELLEENKMKLNDKDIKYPFTNSVLNIHKDKNQRIERIRVQTSFGLKLFWQNDKSGSFGMEFNDHNYDGKVCGLLGNNNGDKSDDLQLKNGNLIDYNKINDKYNFQKVINLMGDSWMVHSLFEPLRCSLYPKQSSQSFSHCSLNNQIVRKSCEFMVNRQSKKMGGYEVSKCWLKESLKKKITRTRIIEDCITEICSCSSSQKDDSLLCYPKVAVQTWKNSCFQNGVKQFPQIEWALLNP